MLQPKGVLVPSLDSCVGSVPLTVAMSPQNARTVMSFAGKLSYLSDPQKPSLSIFSHEPGSRVYEGLFPKFQLPNGKEAFFYYAAGSLQVCGSPCQPSQVRGCCCRNSGCAACKVRSSRSWNRLAVEWQFTR
jgi:hypothetical protein